jgi:thiamine-monophosphate kinase
MPNEEAGGWRLEAGKTFSHDAPSPQPRASSLQQVADLSERELIARVQAHLPPPPDWMLVGIGDDAAVVEPERNRVDVLSVDALVEGIHFDRAFVPPDAIGHRALAVNLSDLAAMGAAPRLALLSMALPASLPLADFDGIITGLTALAGRHRLHIAGGNLTRSPGPLVIDVTIVGTVKRRQALTRAGAQPGDDLYVSGTIGAAAAGLSMLRSQTKRYTTEDTVDTEGNAYLVRDPSSVSSVPSVVKSFVVERHGVERCIERYLRPDPRVRLGVALGRTRAATACIDLSDGLADGVHRLAEASSVGMTIDARAVPIDPAARTFYETRGADTVMEAITGGDDYELLLAARPRMRGRLKAAAQHAGIVLTRIGTCTAERAVLLLVPAGRDAVDAVAVPSGYSHFR